MTDRKRYERLERIFQGALELPPAERAAYLETECAGDAKLRKEVEALLAHDETPTGDFIREPVVASLSGDEYPKRIGPYVHLKHIGEGGFADVFSAEQTEPVRRHVAIKVLKAGLDTRAVLNRFEGERQVLALMDHPSIAKIHDAGTTEQGRPYFVMELVDGESIVDYCQTNRLSLDARLSLFIRVCAAVQHAHQKGIIHRDLKPSNILVTTVDGKPVPKVIDFGIAKATERDASAQTMVTQEGQLIGTPEYISPEQADIGSVNVDTRADIYSLGVVLYQLLTGRLPFSRDSLHKAGLVEIMRILKEEDPPRPSTRVSELDPEDRDTTTSTGLPPKSLARHLRKELDWIVLKALEKNPDRRYDSASGFASDITRYLRDEPIEARPPSAMYQIGKFVKRQRVFIGTLGAIFVVLTLALIDSDRRRRQVELAQAEAEAVTDFLTGMLAEADPYQSGKDVTVVQVLDAAAETVEEDFAERPLVRARIENTVGRVFTLLGEPEKGLVLLQRALDTRLELLGERHHQTAVSLDYMGRVHEDLGNAEESEQFFRDSIEQFVALRGPGHRETLLVRGNLALVLMDAGRTEEADVEFRECLNPAYTWLNPDDEARLNIMDGMANHYSYQGRLDEAEPLYLEVLETRLRISGEDHPAYGSVINNLALLRYDQGRVAECDSLLEYNLVLRRRNLGDDHPVTLGAFQNLAGVRSSQGKYEEARVVYEELLPVAAENPEASLYHTVLNNLGYAYLKLEQYERAETLIVLAHQVRSEQLGEEHQRTLTALHNLGLIEVATGRLTEAESTFRECLEVRERTMGETHPHSVDAMIELGAVLGDQGRADEAVAQLDRALGIASTEFGDEHPRYLRALQERAMVDAGRGNPEAAEPSLLLVCEVLESTQGVEVRQTQLAIADLVALYEVLGRPEAAAQWRVKLAAKP